MREYMKMRLEKKDGIKNIHSEAQKPGRSNCLSLKLLIK